MQPLLADRGGLQHSPQSVDSPIMHARRRAAPFFVALGLTAACASSTRVTPVTEGPQVRYRRMMDAAAQAGREGRTMEALNAYMEVAGASGLPNLAREAYLQAGLLRLGSDAALVDVAEAGRLLRECRILFQGVPEPPELTATLTALERLERVEQVAQDADAAAAVAAREVARRDEDARALRRTVTTLRQQLERRDEALRKAAEAAVGQRPR